MKHGSGKRWATVSKKKSKQPSCDLNDERRAVSGKYLTPAAAIRSYDRPPPRRRQVEAPSRSGSSQMAVSKR